MPTTKEYNAKVSSISIAMGTKIVGIIRRRKRDETKFFGDGFRKRNLILCFPNGRMIPIRGKCGENRQATK
jgi:hypothetical protein